MVLRVVGEALGTFHRKLSDAKGHDVFGTPHATDSQPEQTKRDTDGTNPIQLRSRVTGHRGDGGVGQNFTRLGTVQNEEREHAVDDAETGGNLAVTEKHVVLLKCEVRAALPLAWTKDTVTSPGCQPIRPSPSSHAGLMLRGLGIFSHRKDARIVSRRNKTLFHDTHVDILGQMCGRVSGAAAGISSMRNQKIVEGFG